MSCTGGPTTRRSPRSAVGLGEVQVHAAAVLLGALIASGAMSPLPFKPCDAEDLDAAVALLTDGLGTARFEAAVERGAGLSETAPSDSCRSGSARDA